MKTELHRPTRGSLKSYNTTPRMKENIDLKPHLRHQILHSYKIFYRCFSSILSLRGTQRPLSVNISSEGENRPTNVN